MYVYTVYAENTDAKPIAHTMELFLCIKYENACVFVCVGINNKHGSIESVHDKDVTQKDGKKESDQWIFLHRKKSMFDPERRQKIQIYIRRASHPVFVTVWIITHVNGAYPMVATALFAAFSNLSLSLCVDVWAWACATAFL